MDTQDLQQRIKDRFRMLVVACGGPSACEKILSFPQSHISEAMARHRTDRMPRADHIAVLEAACGQLLVTGFLADIQGYDLEAREHKSSSIGGALVTMLKETGEAAASLAAAVTSGKLDEVSKARNIKELTEARDAIEAAIAAARAA